MLGASCNQETQRRCRSDQQRIDLHRLPRELCYIFAIIGGGPGRESQMATLFFTCPTTHQHVPTGIETDVQSLQAVWKASLKVKCPHCGEVHEISVRETYINGALDDATDRLRTV
jgi:hypothetical protein